MAFLNPLRAALFLMLAFACLRPVESAAAPSKEYQVKAAFLFNFALFTDWPTSAFSGPTAPLVIGVAGKDPFGAFLDQLVAGEKAKGRPIKVRRIERVTEAKGCHILFVSPSERRRFEDDLDTLKGRPILTVSDISRFALRDGVVELVTNRGKIRMRINLRVAKEAGLTISSKLLRPAEIVEGKP